MAVKIVDGSSVHKNFDGILKSFLPHAKKTLGYDKPVDIQLVSDPENAKDPFGKTAYYDPQLMKVTVFVDKRHVKDILRSISHELVHHKQNCEGRLHAPAGEGYAQKDPHLRELEGEAYLEGNGFLFRDFEDKVKGDEQMREEILKETVKRTIKRLLTEVADLAEQEELDEEEQLDEKKKKDSADRRPPDTPADRLRPLEEGEEEELEEGEKPDFLDLDKDGDKEESMKAAAADAKNENWVRKPLNERIYKTLVKKWCK